ncbi:hypothetical protein AAIR98_000113 [Elusimicrobium simillimum]|uniref:hypothetical protein n=1 Tax=Elusimicrobium simillimum TaxID=3143438 RepID=UPI003C6FFF9F
MKKEFDMEVGDDKLPPYKKGDLLHCMAVNTIKGYENKKFIVKDAAGSYFIMKLDKPTPKYEIISVILGRYIPEE